ncbi:hypothetical protein [Chitinophaga sp. sic0106]|uniref:hypothetical protein n=1 Tax=Chitinophaga sp. sic0106 TaxID=2854785 RepID=UPI001C46D7A4|nr:hypothetical protein [Chitinophaga sp. sic0106]MBV7532830.1 hypothetical protein [Chitinophaga sp. sic0106]
MKAVFSLACFLMFAAINVASAQVKINAHDAGICKRMKDSLFVSSTQLDSLQIITIGLSQQKQAARLSTTDQELLRSKMQAIENSRDSLFRNVLTSEQFRLYKAKKGYFLNGSSN